MVDVIQRLMVVVWQNGEYFSWRDREDSGGRPLAEAVPTGADGVSKGLWVKLDRYHFFGPAGKDEQDFDCLLPGFVDSEITIKKDGKLQQFGTRGVRDGRYWPFGFDGKLATRRKPLAAHVWQIGCATFMAVLTNQSHRQLEAMVTILNEFFEEQYRKELPRTLSIPLCLSGVKPLQFTGNNGTYIVPKVPEAVLGRGTFGEVYKGVENASETVYAVKFAAHHEGTLGFEDFEDLFEEVVNREKRNMRMMELVKHKHIIQFQDLCDNGRILVMEHVPYGTSADLYRGLPWPTHSLFRLGLQISSALEHLHMKFGLAHRDVQPANILVRQLVPLRVVLADFGHASLEGDPPVYGNAYYRAPETWGPTEFHCQSDLWSLGATVLNLALQPRFKFEVGDDEHHRLPAMVLRRFADDVGKLTPTMKIFLMGMLREDPATRYCAREVNTSAQWLAGYGERGYPKGYVRTFLVEQGVSAEDIDKFMEPGSTLGYPEPGGSWIDKP